MERKRKSDGVVKGTIVSLVKIELQKMDSIREKFHCEIKYVSTAELERFCENCEKVQILICRDRDVTTDVLDLFHSLEWIFIVSDGIDRLPFAELERRRIRVANTPNLSNESISDYVIGAMMTFSCGFWQLMQYQMECRWKPYAMTKPLKDQTVLIAGTGKIGQEIARKAQTFSMHVYGISKSRKDIKYFERIEGLESLEVLCSKADYVVCTLPLTKETQYLFDRKVFSCMRETAVFINVSRGGLVVEEDLADCLVKKQITGAVLDVFAVEPLPQDSPLWSIENLVVTPHSSGRVENFLGKALDIFCENLAAYCRDKTLISEIDLQKGY